MGNAGSSSAPTFNADAPVRLSQSVINALQDSPESDSTRAQQRELVAQSRVNADLQKIRDSQAQKLDELATSITTEQPAQDSTEDSSSKPSGLFAHLSSPFYHDWTPKDAQPASEPSNRSHDSVSKEIMDLRQKLEQRKKVEKVPAEVEKAKEGLVQCLRHNDRRPLDCWQEVEAFRREVGKLEQAFIHKAGR
ncbi:MICOS complex subunit mic19 [Cercospora beticola]|uniref:MICOS complex subunit mic19 n=1 Tax=Cercospora beticola TaxID=122368 RepID=A0A2G5I6V0_CERBT|nr:MICOS complex subunit mic19 [Cercospora beticola]PIB00489.1 MICOS complex subunit mic19 [Cercospora beticola]WPA96787.1 hypothetical protein RHO25_001395 [Cercospora beticola]CAK1354846.1 unnamed protein product [Cercospora beticola]